MGGAGCDHTGTKPVKFFIDLTLKPPSGIQMCQVLCMTLCVHLFKYPHCQLRGKKSCKLLLVELLIYWIYL